MGIIALLQMQSGFLAISAQINQQLFADYQRLIATILMSSIPTKVNHG